MTTRISRKYGKSQVQFSGGPYSGDRFPLSVHGCSLRTQPATLRFSAKGHIGYYDRTGLWHGSYVGKNGEVNENIVLSETE